MQTQLRKAYYLATRESKLLAIQELRMLYQLNAQIRLETDNGKK